MEQYLQILNKIREKIKLFYESYYFESVKNKVGILGISEVMQMLNYKDLRSVLNWCAANEVMVISQGNIRVVNRTQFILAFYKPLIEHLKCKHSDWQNKFSAILDGSFSDLIDRSKTQKANCYSPKSKAEKDFLSKMKGL